MSVARHEASHAACAILLGRHVEHTSRETGLALPGDEVGRALIPVGERIELSQVTICVIGYMSEDEPGWPPDFEAARTEKREALGKVIRLLGVNREAYEACVEMARDMLADTDLFTPLRDAIERALTAVPRLEAEDIEALAAIHLPQGGLTLKQRLEYKSFPTRFLTLDGQPVRPEPVAQDDYADLADLSISELRAYGDATFKHLGIDTRPPPRIVSFEC